MMLFFNSGLCISLWFFRIFFYFRLDKGGIRVYFIWCRFGLGPVFSSKAMKERRICDGAKAAGSDATGRRKFEKSSEKRLTKRKSVLYFISPAWFGGDFEFDGSDHWERAHEWTVLRSVEEVFFSKVSGENKSWKFLKRALTNTKSMLY